MTLLYTLHSSWLLEDFVFKDSILKLSCILADFKGVMCTIINMLAYGSTYKEQTERLEVILN